MSVDYVVYMQSSAWQRKRISALNLYGHWCAVCSATTKLHVHHRTYVRLGRERLADLAILCERCHARLHDYANRSGFTIEEASEEVLSDAGPRLTSEARRRRPRRGGNFRPRPRHFAFKGTGGLTTYVSHPSRTTTAFSNEPSGPRRLVRST